MANDNVNNADKKVQEREKEIAPVKPEPETLHTTDPQKNMEGPISSFVKGLGEGFSTNETKKEADEKREKNM